MAPPPLFIHHFNIAAALSRFRVVPVYGTPKPSSHFTKTKSKHSNINVLQTSWGFEQ